MYLIKIVDSRVSFSSFGLFRPRPAFIRRHRHLQYRRTGERVVLSFVIVVTPVDRRSNFEVRRGLETTETTHLYRLVGNIASGRACRARATSVHTCVTPGFSKSCRSIMQPGASSVVGSVLSPPTHTSRDPPRIELLAQLRSDRLRDGLAARFLLWRHPQEF
ncbi:hypothetical protein GGR58DRAFT_144443 [Xylaria digitata]|nr:hypothetical protein GGR58DRAFT_144443 [Xylaria digitata]